MLKLGEQLLKPFDDQILKARNSEREIVNAQFIHLIQERSELHGYEYDPSLIIQNASEKERETTTQLEKLIEQIVSDYDRERAIKFTIDQTNRLKKDQFEELSLALNRFKSEDELKEWFVAHLSNDFYLHTEVKGKHLAENVNVRIDYILYPKNHLISEGFESAPFGVEVKYIKQEEGFTRKASRAFWQTISYGDCEFEINNMQIKPKVCLLFSNLSFKDEEKLLCDFNGYYSNDHSEWSGMLHLANHAKAGRLLVKGSRSDYRGWEMRFASGLYFTCAKIKGKWTYRVSNEDVINKVRVGNF
ncbi:hypothetical protein [Mariprofundus sp. NF]|uniref:hypothetical protein n=1 Tax=Mariprofundus sp. NF TaxID=2608716 RepID=UPI0015A21849|nr:hypothetical protein [Mariprofundus sp. NF]